MVTEGLTGTTGITEAVVPFVSGTARSVGIWLFGSFSIVLSGSYRTGWSGASFLKKRQ